MEMESLCHVALQDLHCCYRDFILPCQCALHLGCSSLHFGTVPPGRELAGLIWPSTAGLSSNSAQCRQVPSSQPHVHFSYSARANIKLTSCVAHVYNITCRCGKRFQYVFLLAIEHSWVQQFRSSTEGTAPSTRGDRHFKICSRWNLWLQPRRDDSVPSPRGLGGFGLELTSLGRSTFQRCPERFPRGLVGGLSACQRPKGNIAVCS